MRIGFLPREKSAYCILRKKGHSINAIANFFGRSTSVVYRAIKQFRFYGDVKRFDMRKLPCIARMRMASFRRALMENLRSQWETWALGEGEDPP